MSILTEAEEIMEGKAETHGPPEDSFERIACYWWDYLGIEGKLAEGETIEKEDVAEMMALFKLARAQSGRYNEDDYRDRAGYVKFANEFRNE